MPRITKKQIADDKKYAAKKAGQRVSEKVAHIKGEHGYFDRRNVNQYGKTKGGNEYYEDRTNRSDVSRRERYESGGEIDELKIKLAKVEKGLSYPEVANNPILLDATKRKIEKLKEQIAELESKGEKHSAETTQSASETAQTKSKGKPSKSAASKKRRMKKEKVAPVKKAAEQKGRTLITVNGKEYDLEDCQEAIKAWKARKEQATKTQKKYKSKSPSLKAKENMEDVISNITDTIGKKAMENEPKQVVGALRTFKKKMDEAFSALGKVLSETEVKRLKSALNEIEEVIKGIEAKTK
jgi:DNA repair exonuclease SbcCD ATPase subunit